MGTEKVLAFSALWEWIPYLQRSVMTISQQLSLMRISFRSLCTCVTTLIILYTGQEVVESISNDGSN